MRGITEREGAQRETETGRQAGRQTDRQRHTDHTETHRARETDRQTDRDTKTRETDRQTDRDTERQRQRSTYTFASHTVAPLGWERDTHEGINQGRHHLTLSSSLGLFSSLKEVSLTTLL